jgi:hypothetical protein
VQQAFGEGHKALEKGVVECNNWHHALDITGLGKASFDKCFMLRTQRCFAESSISHLAKLFENNKISINDAP